MSHLLSGPVNKLFLKQTSMLCVQDINQISFSHLYNMKTPVLVLTDKDSFY